MKKLRVYLDTSVFGGCFDDEFIDESTALFEEIILGRFVVVISATTLREIRDAPQMVRDLVKKIPKKLIDYIGPSDEIDFLRENILKQELLGRVHY
jgi:hypothetical protein